MNAEQSVTVHMLTIMQTPYKTFYICLNGLELCNHYKMCIVTSLYLHYNPLSTKRSKLIYID